MSVHALKENGYGTPSNPGPGTWRSGVVYSAPDTSYKTKENNTDNNNKVLYVATPGWLISTKYISSRMNYTKA